MPRPILDERYIHPAIRSKVSEHHQAIVQEVIAAIKDNDVVVVCSEFGRTSAENGTRGTDHGHGNAMWLMGNAVQGGQWHGHGAACSPTNYTKGAICRYTTTFGRCWRRCCNAARG